MVTLLILILIVDSVSFWTSMEMDSPHFKFKEQMDTNLSEPAKEDGEKCEKAVIPVGTGREFSK